MPEWIYFIHPPRDDFAATMTAEEQAVWAEHFKRLQLLLAEGTLILAGPTLGSIGRPAGRAAGDVHARGAAIGCDESLVHRPFAVAARSASACLVIPWSVRMVVSMSSAGN